MSISQILNGGGGFTSLPPPDTNMYQHYTNPPAQTALPPSKPPPKQIHRNRASYSCFACRRRKIKCDRQHPVCGGCTKMGVQCEWSDNSHTNSGKDEAKGRQASTTSNGSNDGEGEQSTSPKPPRGHKRQRTNPSNKISDDSDSQIDENRFAVPALGGAMMHSYHPNTANGTVLPHHPPGPPGRPRNGPQKENELESRMSRLAEIVDRWYRDAYINREGGGNGGSGGNGGNIDEQGRESLRRDLEDLQKLKGGLGIPDSGSSPRSADLQLPGGLRSPGYSYEGAPPEHPRMRGLRELENMASSPKSPTNSGESNIDPRITGGDALSEFEKERERLKSITDVALRPGEANGVDDLALGHLSIQEHGRSRYVGSTFWAFISNEITELNQVLRSHSAQGDQIPPPPSESGIGDGRSVLEDPTAMHSVVTPTSSRDSPQDRNKGSPVTTNICDRQLDITTHLDGSATVTQVFGAEHLSHGHTAGLLTDTSLLRDLTPPDHTASDACKVIPKILRFLPTNDQCNALYKSFLNGVHPVIPLMHIPTFEKDWDDFFSWWPKKAMVPNAGPGIDFDMGPSFMPLVFAVLYSGALSMSTKKFKEVFPAEGHTRSAITTHLYCCANITLSITTFPRSPTISSLIAFLILQTCLIREEEPLTSCSFIGLAMRVAQSMGLHRDGALFRGFNEIEREVRRRVWWHIVYLDVQAAVATGLPPLAGSDGSNFDTRMPCDLRDELIGVNGPRITREDILKDERHTIRKCDGTAESVEMTKSSPAMIAAVGRYEATLVLRRLVASLFGIKPPARNDITAMGEIIFEMNKKLEARIARIPARGVPEMGLVPPESRPEDEFSEAEKRENFNGWARVMLSLQCDKAFGVLYQPFLKNTKSKLWHHARQCALRSCHSFLRKFVYLSTSPQFRPFHWFIPGTVQPLHSAMILLLDLFERPNSPEAPTGRMFLDQVFAIFGPDGNKVNAGDSEDDDFVQRPLLEGGKEAWKMMGRLRRKAYAKAGVEVNEDGSVNRSKEGSQSTAERNGDLSLHKCPYDAADTPRTQPDTNGNVSDSNPRVTNDNASSALFGDKAHTGNSAMAGQSQTQSAELPRFGGPQAFGGPQNAPTPGSQAPDNHAMNYFHPPSVAGISVDQYGAPLLVAPGANMNMETFQVHRQNEDHGGSLNTPAAQNQDFLMDISTEDFDWEAWDASTNWLMSNETFEDFQNMSSFLSKADRPHRLQWTGDNDQF